MSDNVIRINDIGFTVGSGRPMTFQGKHSGKTLSGMDMDFPAEGQAGIEAVEGLFANETVQVVDPFAGRSYEATLRQVSCSYQEGHPERYYDVEIRELDTPPQFQTLDIDGHEFPVAKYIESDCENGVIGWHALLRLSKDQFIELQGLLRPGTAEVKRLGVDDKYLTVRYGGAMYWSEHREGSSVFYKQIVRFFPPDHPSSTVSLAAGAEQDALAEMVVKLSVRLEALVGKLAASRTLPEEQCRQLLGDDWRRLLGKDRIQDILAQTERVPDAEEHLD